MTADRDTLRWPLARWPIALAATSLLLFATGCSNEIESVYGQRKGPIGGLSVNGTAVLAGMFERAGHKVYSWGTLSPRLETRADCIVWFPDDFEPPSDEVRHWLENWLFDRPGRTLIYVGRDFDAAAWYWEKVESGAPAEQIPKLRTKRREAKSDFRLQRQRTSVKPVFAKKTAPSPSPSPTPSPSTAAAQAAAADEDISAEPWYTVEMLAEPRRIRTLQSDDAAWTATLKQVDVSKVEIELSSRIVPPPSADVLLSSHDDVLISRDAWDDSQLIVVANGSFLLNLPLVDHEHRKLAGRLIDEIGPPAKTVVFLESYAGGPPISDSDPSASIPTGFEILIGPQTRWLFLHLAVMGVLFCIWRWPIFGLPRPLDPEAPSDFGKHIRAMAELLEQSHDETYAMTRVLHYQQTTKVNE